LFFFDGNKENKQTNKQTISYIIYPACIILNLESFILLI